ncbi:hypothetical protein [Streptomyces sp. NPDC096105]|uniref:hypothetical protein n=1 Tax=Streptomyces sp. NPDC096105 TaxID=3366074 RepID=UPI00380E583F
MAQLRGDCRATPELHQGNWDRFELQLEYWLQPGDLVIDATGDNITRHVVIFKEWNDAARRTCTAYGQRDVRGTGHRTLAYGLTAGSQYEAHRQFLYGN